MGGPGMYVYDTITYRGMTINIVQDTDAQNPRDWGSDFTMACIHTRYTLGDEQPSSSDALLEELSGIDFNGDRFVDLSYEQLKERMYKEINAKYIWLPLHLYDHSGITMSTSSFSCRWDSGQVGIIYISLEKARKVFNVKKISPKLREKILLYMQGDVKTYDDWLTGEVYGFVIEETDESVWGYYGSNHKESGVITAAQEAIDHYISENSKQHWRKLKAWIRNQVPLINREHYTLT